MFYTTMLVLLFLLKTRKCPKNITKDLYFWCDYLFILAIKCVFIYFNAECVTNLMMLMILLVEGFGLIQ